MDKHFILPNQAFESAKEKGKNRIGQNGKLRSDLLEVLRIHNQVLDRENAETGVVRPGFQFFLGCSSEMCDNDFLTQLLWASVP